MQKWKELQAATTKLPEPDQVFPSLSPIMQFVFDFYVSESVNYLISEKH